MTASTSKYEQNDLSPHEMVALWHQESITKKRYCQPETTPSLAFTVQDRDTVNGSSKEEWWKLKANIKEAIRSNRTKRVDPRLGAVSTSGGRLWQRLLMSMTFAQGGHLRRYVPCL